MRSHANWWCRVRGLMLKYGIVGGGLLRYRKWIPKQLGDVDKQVSGDSRPMGAQHGDTAANHTQSGCCWVYIFAVRGWSNLWDLICSGLPIIPWIDCIDCINDKTCHHFPTSPGRAHLRHCPVRTRGTWLRITRGAAARSRHHQRRRRLYLVYPVLKIKHSINQTIWIYIDNFVIFCFSQVAVYHKVALVTFCHQPSDSSQTTKVGVDLSYCNIAILQFCKRWWMQLQSNSQVTSCHDRSRGQELW